MLVQGWWDNLGKNGWTGNFDVTVAGYMKGPAELEEWIRQPLGYPVVDGAVQSDRVVKLVAETANVEELLNRLYDSNGTTREVVARKLLMGPEGVLCNPDAARRVIHTLLASRIQMSDTVRPVVHRVSWWTRWRCVPSAPNTHWKGSFGRSERSSPKTSATLPRCWRRSRLSLAWPVSWEPCRCEADRIPLTANVLDRALYQEISPQDSALLKRLMGGKCGAGELINYLLHDERNAKLRASRDALVDGLRADIGGDTLGSAEQMRTAIRAIHRRRLRVPLHFRLIRKNLTTLDRWSRRAGFENGLKDSLAWKLAPLEQLKLFARFV